MKTHHVLSHLCYFLSVYNNGSYAKVAKEYNISLSAVSYQIKVLEEKLKVPLLTRLSGQKPILTEEGRYLGSRATELFNHIDELLAEFISEEVNKAYKISSPVSFGTNVLVPLIESIGLELPDPDLTLILNNKPVSVEDNEVDIAIQNFLPEDDVEYDELTKVYHVLIASKQYLKSSPPIFKPSDLSQHTIISLDNSRYRNKANIDDWERICQYFNIKLPDADRNIKIRISTNNNSIIKNVLLDKGIGIIPWYVYNNIARKHSLALVLEDFITNEVEEIKDTLFICYPKLSIRRDNIVKIVSLLKNKLSNKN